MLTGRHPGSNDDGETLIELIIAMAIMGITVVGIVGGITASILMSDVHRKQAAAGAYVRNYAEAVETYAAAGSFDATTSTLDLKKAVGFADPAGFTVSVEQLKCWKASGNFGDCAKGDTVQVTLKVASTDSRASESIVVVVG